MESRKVMRSNRAEQKRRARRLKRFLVEALVLLMVLIPLSAWAVTVNWSTAVTSGQWNTKGSWVGGAIPGNNDTAQIDNETSIAVTAYVVGNRQIGILNLSSDDTLIIGKTSAGVITAGSLQMNLTTGITNDKEIYIYGDATNVGALSSNAASVALGGSGTYILSGGSNYAQARVNATGANTFSLGSSATIRGAGTISAPITNAGKILAGGGTLDVTGVITNSSGTIGTYDPSGVFDNHTGADMTATKITMAGGTMKSTSTKKFTSTNLSGFGEITAAFDNGVAGGITASGGILKLSQALTNPGTLTVSASPATFDNNTGSAIAFSTVNMQGGTLASTSGNFNNTGTNFYGLGNVSAQVTNTGTIKAKGGTLTFTGNVPNTGGIMTTDASTDILDLRSIITGGQVNASPGEVDLFGATLSGLTLGAGNVRLTGNSIFSGIINSSAGINTNTKTLDMSGATLNLIAGSPLTNTGAITIGSGTLNNSSGSPFTLGGGGGATLAGGSITGSAFISDNAISGYGAISAPLTNSGTVKAKGGPLQISGDVGNSSGILNTFGSSDVLDLRSTITGGQVNASPGEVDLFGATLSGLTLGAGNVRLTGNSTFGGIINSSAGIITNGHTLSMSGATLNLNAGSPLTNTGAITIGSGTLNNSSGGPFTLGGGGGATLAGGSITGSAFNSDNAISGYGTISAGLTNTGTLTATGTGNTLSVSGAVTGSGNVNVGTTTLGDTATLALQANLSATNFTLNQSGILDVTPGNLITLSGNFNNLATSTSQWLPAAGFGLSMTGSTFEVAGYDYGAVGTGFNNNFNLASLNLPATAHLQLVDLVNNNNRGGAHGDAEALYIYSLTGDSGAVLDLDHKIWVYVMKDGSPIALGDGLYNYVLVENAPVPILSTIFLLGSGLVGMVLLRFRRQVVAA